MRKIGGKVSGRGRCRVFQVILLTLTGLLPVVAHAARPVQLPDHLEVYGAEMNEDGVITATGGAALYITSLVEGAEIVIQADDVTYDTNSGTAELQGHVNLSVTGTRLSINCDYLEYDPVMERMEVKDATLSLPLHALVEPGRVPGAGSLVTEETHYYNVNPDNIYLASGLVEFDMSRDPPAVVMHDVRLSANSNPDPDLFIHADQVSFTDAEHVVFKDISLRASGVELLSWPRLSRGLKPKPKMFSLDFPKFRVNRKVGLAWQQRMSLDLGIIKSDATLDYSPEYGLLTHDRTYYSPAAGLEVGLANGTQTVVDLKRRNIERRDEAVAYLTHRYQHPFGTVDTAFLDVEYGDVHATTRTAPTGDTLPGEVQDTRFHTDLKMDFMPVPLGNQWYFASGAGVSYSDYEDAGESYRVIGGKAGFVWRQPGFDHYLIYQSRNRQGDPVFSFDEQRSQELDFGTSFRLHPEWHHVVQGVYDIDLGEFDKLQVGAMKKQRTYEIGLFYDFARENAGIEFGLLTDNLSGR